MRIAVAGGTGTVGRHVVDVLREHGHQPVVLARSMGVDVLTGAGLAAAGVGHHLLLGIVGSQKSDYGYYAGKQLQEQLIRAGSVPWTELRATQFHEFAGQILNAARLGPLRLTPKMVSHPIAAREVAERLVERAAGSPSGLVAELAGPKVERMARLVRAYAAATGIRGPIVEIPLPGPGGTSMRDGTLLPDPDLQPPAQLGRQTFDSWLAARHE